MYTIKRLYGLEKAEIHVAWLLRPYAEQIHIANFDALSYRDRASRVQALRTTELLRLQRVGKRAQYQQTRKNYRKTQDYIHLSYPERRQLVTDVALAVASWQFARLFAECIDKVYFESRHLSIPMEEQAFEQIVSRFEQFLHIAATQGYNDGLIIHDNNETVAHRHTELMKRFHQKGTLFTNVEHIIETPLFVNSQLTSMVQISDLCSYALRRYLENKEEQLFDLIFQRADRKGEVVVGARHYTDMSCVCKICEAHRPQRTSTGSLSLP